MWTHHLSYYPEIIIIILSRLRFNLYLAICFSNKVIKLTVFILVRWIKLGLGCLLSKLGEVAMVCRMAGKLPNFLTANNITSSKIICNQGKRL